MDTSGAVELKIEGRGINLKPISDKNERALLLHERALLLHERALFLFA